MVLEGTAVISDAKDVSRKFFCQPSRRFELVEKKNGNKKFHKLKQIFCERLSDEFDAQIKEHEKGRERMREMVERE